MGVEGPLWPCGGLLSAPVPAGGGPGYGTGRRRVPPPWYVPFTPVMSSATAVREGDRVSAALPLVFGPASKYKALYFVKSALVSRVVSGYFAACLSDMHPTVATRFSVLASVDQRALAERQNSCIKTRAKTRDNAAVRWSRVLCLPRGGLLYATRHARCFPPAHPPSSVPLTTPQSELVQGRGPPTPTPWAAPRPRSS